MSDTIAMCRGESVGLRGLSQIIPSIRSPPHWINSGRCAPLPVTRMPGQPHHITRPYRPASSLGRPTGGGGGCQLAPGPCFTNRNYSENGVGFPENGVACFQIWRYDAIFWGRLPQFWSRYVCKFGETRPWFRLCCDLGLTGDRGVLGGLIRLSKLTTLSAYDAEHQSGHHYSHPQATVYDFFIKAA